MIRVQGDYTAPEPDKIVKSVKFSAKDFDSKWTAEEADVAVTSKGVVKGVSTDRDPKIYTKSLKIDASKISHVRINAKVNKISAMELFYITEKNPAWDQNQSFRVIIEPGKTSGICARANQPGLDSPIIGIRIDPAIMSGIEFEITGVDFMIDTKKPVMFVDGTPHPINSPVVVKDGYTLYPFNPYYVLLSRIGLCYEYNAPTKELSFYSKNGGSAVFTIGTRNAVINGEKKLLDTPIELFDGLPLVPLEVMSKALGFDFKYKAPRLDIYSK